MKRLWQCGERVTASGWDAVNFSDGTSFHASGARGHARCTRDHTEGVPGETRRTSGHKDRIPHVARCAPAHAGDAPAISGCVPSVSGGSPDLAMSLPGVTECVSNAARCVSGVTDVQHGLLCRCLVAEKFELGQKISVLFGNTILFSHRFSFV